jgi:hypothetical protein
VGKIENIKSKQMIEKTLCDEKCIEQDPFDCEVHADMNLKVEQVMNTLLEKIDPQYVYVRSKVMEIIKDAYQIK